MTRAAHDDAADVRILTADELALQQRLIAIEAHAERAEVELRNLLERRPDLRRPPLLMAERLRDLTRWLGGVRDARKGGGM